MKYPIPPPPSGGLTLDTPLSATLDCGALMPRAVIASVGAPNEQRVDSGVGMNECKIKGGPAVFSQAYLRGDFHFSSVICIKSLHNVKFYLYKRGRGSFSPHKVFPLAYFVVSSQFLLDFYWYLLGLSSYVLYDHTPYDQLGTDPFRPTLKVRRAWMSLSYQ